MERQKRLREKDETEDVSARRQRVTPSTNQHPQNVSTQGEAFIKQG